MPAWRLLGVRRGAGRRPALARLADGGPRAGARAAAAGVRRGGRATARASSFTVLGSAGVGKSRLVEEFLSTARRRAERLRGRCLPYGEGITFLPVVEVDEQAAGLADFDLSRGRRAKVCAVLDGGRAPEPYAGSCRS